VFYECLWFLVLRLYWWIWCGVNVKPTSVLPNLIKKAQGQPTCSFFRKPFQFFPLNLYSTSLIHKKQLTHSCFPWNIIWDRAFAKSSSEVTERPFLHVSQTPNFCFSPFAVLLCWFNFGISLRALFSVHLCSCFSVS